MNTRSCLYIKDHHRLEGEKKQKSKKTIRDYV